MAVKTYTLRQPTPDQSQWVKFFMRSIDPTDQIRIKMGYNENNVPRCYRLIYLQLYATTSANVANRYLRTQCIMLSDEESISQQIFQIRSDVIAASKSARLCLSPIGVIENCTNYGLDVNGSAELKDTIILSGEDYITNLLDAAEANDNWIVGALFEYQNHIKGIMQ